MVMRVVVWAAAWRKEVKRDARRLQSHSDAKKLYGGGNKDSCLSGLILPVMQSGLCADCGDVKAVDVSRLLQPQGGREAEYPGSRPADKAGRSGLWDPGYCRSSLTTTRREDRYMSTQLMFPGHAHNTPHTATVKAET